MLVRLKEEALLCRVQGLTVEPVKEAEFVRITFLRLRQPDPDCAAMAYLHFSLLHSSALVARGDTSPLRSFRLRHTPAGILGG
jgi:hypothetical protein